MNSAQLINQDSGDVEYYTPPEIVEAARRVLGAIDLDPFSSATANERVNAVRYFTRADDGFAQPWAGRIWCNHPFGRKTNPAFSRKWQAEIARPEVVAVINISFAATSERWFRPFMSCPQCYISPRLNYVLPCGSIKRGVTKGSVVTYYGPDVAAFYREFSRFGVLKAPAVYL
jgi:hypothetical protein